MNRLELKNKNYVITGASSGLGLALVKRLMRIEGTKIIAVARDIKPLERLPRNKVFPLSADVSKPENIDPMLDAAIEKMGKIDCVIACAGFGYYERFGNVNDFPVKNGETGERLNPRRDNYRHINRIFRTNVISPLYTLKRLLAKTNGKISFTVISSAIGKFGVPGMALYCATKFALDGFADAYRFEKPGRLHYMTVYPIGLETHFWERISNNIPLPRPLQKADAAAKAVINGIWREKRSVGTSAAATAVWVINRFLPVFVPAYQAWNKKRFDNWRSGEYGAARHID